MDELCHVHLPINFIYDAVHDFLQERPFKLNCLQLERRLWPAMNYDGWNLQASAVMKSVVVTALRIIIYP
jgi:hypothetical protein